jgi:N-acylneuraminate cytidylyltransferase
LGKPLIAHSIDQARRARLVSRVVVSTDDAEIGAIAQQYEAEVVWRPAEISGDSATSESALLHVLEHLAAVEGYQPDLLVFLQCTSPLTLAEDIDGTIQLLTKSRQRWLSSFITFWRQEEDGNAVGSTTTTSSPAAPERQPQYLEVGLLTMRDWILQPSIVSSGRPSRNARRAPGTRSTTGGFRSPSPAAASRAIKARPPERIAALVLDLTA